MGSSNSGIDERSDIGHAASSIPTVIRRIVFGYTLDHFPSAIILGHNQLKRMLERAGFAIKVTMAPLTDLPPDVDILFVPPELEQAAQAILAPERIQVLEDMVNHPRYANLVQQLTERVTITAARQDEHATENAGNIITYRGYQRVE